MLTHERLMEVLSYDPYTGIFTWLARPSLRVRIGDVAGGLSRGYVVIRIDGTLYQASHLAWFYMKREFQKFEIDHKNGKKNENRFGNLRDVSRVVNAQNRHGPQVNNRIGVLGVCPGKAGNFRTQITIRGKTENLGTYSTPEQAHAAYLEAKRRLHPGNTL